LAALVGSKLITVSMTGTQGDFPPLQVVAQTGDATLAKSVADAAKLFGPKVTAVQQGAEVRLTTPGYAPRGRLADEDLFRLAMRDMPAAPVTAVYVDLQRLLAATSDGDPERLRQTAALKAVGATFARSGDAEIGLIRLVIT
jgi:hypothetical protein